MQWAGPEPAARAGGSGRRRFDAGAAGDENEKAVGRSASAGQHGASGEHLPPHMGQELWRRRRDQDTRRRRRRRQGEVVGAQQRGGGGKRSFDPLLGRIGWSLRWAGRCGDVNHSLPHLSGKSPPPPTSYRFPQTRLGLEKKRLPTVNCHRHRRHSAWRTRASSSHARSQPKRRRGRLVCSFESVRTSTLNTPLPPPCLPRR